MQKVIVWKKKDLFFPVPSFLHVQIGGMKGTCINGLHH